MHDLSHFGPTGRGTSAPQKGAGFLLREAASNIKYLETVGRPQIMLNGSSRTPTSGMRNSPPSASRASI